MSFFVLFSTSFKQSVAYLTAVFISLLWLSY